MIRPILPRPLLVPVVTVAVAFVCAACPPAAGEGEGEEDLVAEACEHMQEGPSNAVTAALAFADAPDVSAAHTRQDITLVDLDGEGPGADLGGSVVYSVGAAGDLVAFLDVDVPLAFFSSSGAAITPVQSDPVDACAEVVVQHVVNVPVGTVELRLGPTTTTIVHAVLEAGSDP